MKLIEAISDKLLSQHPKSSYARRPRQILFAALTIKSTKNVVYAQLNPGSGKTWMLILVGLHYQSLGFKVVYCTI